MDNVVLQPKFLYVPENLALAEVLPDHRHWHDYAAYLISTINRRIVYERLDKDAYVPLMSAILKRVLPKRDYRTIIELLADSRIIQVDDSYQAGKKSKGYRLTSKYRGRIHSRYLATDQTFLQKLAKLHLDLAKNDIDPVHRHLKRLVEEIDFCFDGDVRSFGEFSLQAMQLVDHDLYFNVKDDFGHRFHSNVTNLKKELRRHLRYQGKTLVNVDVVNSQPFLLGVVLVNFYLNGHDSLSTSHTFNVNNHELYHDPDILKSVFQKGEGEAGPLCGNIHIGSLGIPEDLKRYLELCVDGKLYEYIMDNHAIPTRDELKAKLWQVLFAKNHEMKHMPLTWTLEKHFPSVISAITKIKEKDSKHLPSLLQRMESSVIVNRICRRMMNEQPGIFVSPIYDSILTTQDGVGVLSGMMRQELGGLIGVAPKVKVEALTGPSGTPVGLGRVA